MGLSCWDCTATPSGSEQSQPLNPCIARGFLLAVTPHSSLPGEAGKLDWGVTALKKPRAVQGLGG